MSNIKGRSQYKTKKIFDMGTKYRIREDNDLWATTSIALARISYHSKKMENLRKIMLSERHLLSLSKVKELSTKLDEQEEVEHDEIKNLLSNLKGLQSVVANNEIKENHNYTVLITSIDQIVTAFEQLIQKS